MSVDITSLVMDKYHLNEHIKKIEYHEKCIAELQARLERRCTHPTVVTTEKYNGGGYDYVSSVRITKTCTLCDKVLESYDDPKHRGSHA